MNKRTEEFTETMEPGEMELATMEGSESQIVHPLGRETTSETRPVRADFPMKEGNLPEASSIKESKSSSPRPGIWLKLVAE